MNVGDCSMRKQCVCPSFVRSWHIIALCIAMLPVDSFRMTVDRSSRMMTMTPLQVLGSSGDDASMSSSSSLSGRLQYAANDVISGIQSSNVKVGVLFLNLGGPETTQDVEGFLYNLFADPDIIRLPSFLSLLQKPIAYVIAKRRAPKSTVAYQSIGGGSPIVKYTNAQASLIQSALQQRGLRDAKCYFAMRYWNPYTEEVLDQMQRDGINTMVVVPLYPQYSISTSGSSLKLLEEIFANNPDTWGRVSHTVVPAWYYRKGYVQAMAHLVVNELLEHYSLADVSTPGGIHVLFSAHGVPESYIVAGDPYQRQIEECVKLIGLEVNRLLATDSTSSGGDATAKRFPRDVSLALAGEGQASSSSTVRPIQYHLSFQSRVGPVEWLKPYTEETLIELGESGVVNLIVVPVSFVSEHIETLEEIDMEYRELAEEHGITNWRRVPALNTDDRFIEDMADLVCEALEAPAVTLSEAASQYTGPDNSNNNNNNQNTGGEGMTPFEKVMDAEKLNGRFAMMGVMGTTAFELLAGHPVVQMVGLR